MLTPRKRITKKELKEDKLVTYYAKVSQWAEENYKLLTAIAAGILVVIIASIFISNSRQKSEAIASTKLAQAIRIFDSNDYTSAINVLSDIVDNHRSTKSAAIAHLYLAQSLYRTDEFAGAEEHFKAAAKKVDEMHMKATALAGVAACEEQQGNYADAAQKYSAIVDKYPDAPQAAYYLLRSARCYEMAKDTVMAQSLYERIVQDYPTSQERQDALLLNAMH